MFGLTSSLYDDLDSETISSLEKAVYLYKIRIFSDSLAIFESFSAPLRHKPIIAAENSTALLTQWRIKDAASVLDEAILYAEGEDPTFTQPGPYTLLRALRARAGYISQGCFLKARDSLREIKHWLYGTPIESYTDLQVSIGESGYSKSNTYSE